MMDVRRVARGTVECGMGIAAGFLFSWHDFPIHDPRRTPAVRSGIRRNRVDCFPGPSGEYKVCNVWLFCELLKWNGHPRHK